MEENQSTRICRRMDLIDRKIMIMSGKGGVGKTTLTVNLAKALAKAGFFVGILDTDIHGPNIAKMLGCEDAILTGEDKVIDPVITSEGIKVVSISFALSDPEEAVVFRGPMKLNVIKQFLSDVNWGKLDYLLIDTPPGTGDEQLAAAQNIPALAGCLIVTTPHDVSVLDSTRTVSFARQLGMKIIGVVENMSTFICPHCLQRIDIFGTGGAEKLCKKEGIPLLGKIPLSIDEKANEPFYGELAKTLHENTKPLKSSDIGYTPKEESCSPSACATCQADCPSRKAK